MTRWPLALRCALSVCAMLGAACRGSSTLSPVAPTVHPATFEVRLHRAHKPGDRGMVSTVVRSQRTTTVVEGDRLVRRETDDREIDLEAIMDVLRVDARGTPVSLAYTIEHMVLQTPAGRTEILPGGWIVSAERGTDRATFRAAQPLPTEAREALDEILSPLSSESSDDDVFGTPEPRTPGAVWPVNATLAAKELHRMHFDVPVEAIHGQSQLVGLVEVDGRVCLDVAGEISIRDAHLLDVPGARPEAAELHSTYRTRIPVDAASQEVDATLRIDMDITARIPLGPDREGKLTTTSHRETRRRFMPMR